MTDKIVAFPTARPLVGQDPAPGSLAVMNLRRAFAETDRALSQLQVTQDLMQQAAEAMEAVDIEQMEAVRNILAARISKRRADRERYRASA